jgi:glucan 1,3-beta-glucosidase
MHSPAFLAAGNARRSLIILAAIVAATASALLALAASGQPRQIPEAPVDRIECLSYAPFRDPADTPYDPAARVSRERIEVDLRILLQRTNCVRTYSIDQGLDAVPEVAAALGMEVLLGAWLGRDRVANALELDRAIALAQKYRGTVRALVVGNEVLLRRELPEHELEQALKRARAQAGVPVTYADVWEFWLRHRGLAASVDFATVHILPYWEDEPVGIDSAVAHVRDIYRLMQAELAGREVLIGETGWPSAGRARLGAQPGRVEQAWFMREFVTMAQAEHIPYNLIEAFDQPWKRRLEGAMGGHWGVFDSAGQAKFPWHGPVAANPGWRAGLWSAALLALVFGSITLALRPGRAGLALSPSGGMSALGAAASILAGAATGVLLFAQWRYLQAWSRDAIEWLATMPFLFATAPLAWLGLHQALAPAGAGRSRAMALALRWLDPLRMMFLFGAAVNVVLLVFDARYRGFPVVFFLLPAAVEVLRLLSGQAAIVSKEVRLLSMVVAIGAACVLLDERPANQEALGYAALMFGYALARTDGRPLRTRARAPNSAPIAEGS